MTDLPKSRSTNFSIVVVGPMNPRLHHPLWYQVIGAMTEAEVKDAAAQPNLVVAEPFATFSAGGITIACQAEKWQIGTEAIANRPRLLEITDKVFTKLFETPVQLFGVNSNFNVETKVKDVGRCLGKLQAELNIGLPEDGKKSASLIYYNEHESYRNRIEVGPSTLAPELLYVGYNTEQRINTAKPGYFDLIDFLREPFERNLIEASESASRIAAAVQQRCGE